MLGLDVFMKAAQHDIAILIRPEKQVSARQVQTELVGSWAVASVWWLR